jgi:MFS family permease
LACALGALLAQLALPVIDRWWIPLAAFAALSGVLGVALMKLNSIGSQPFDQELPGYAAGVALAATRVQKVALAVQGGFPVGALFAFAGFWAGPFLTQYFPYTPAEAGWLQAALTLGFVAGILAVATVASERTRRKWLMVLIANAVAAGTLVALSLAPVNTKGGFVFMGLFFFGYSVGWGIPLTAAIAANVSHQRNLEIGMAVAQVTAALLIDGSGLAVGPEEFGKEHKFAAGVFAPPIAVLGIAILATLCLRTAETANDVYLGMT